MRTNDRTTRVGALPLSTRTRLIAFAAGVAAATVLVSAGSSAVAAPSAPSSSTSSSSTSSSSTSSSPTSTTRTPAATAPAAPVDHGPPCSTDADKLYPVVCLPTGAGEDRTASVPPGTDIEFDAQLVNNGPDVADATAVITLPAGLGLDPDEDDPVYRVDGWYKDDEDDAKYTDLSCRGGPSTITCSVGALPTHANALVTLDLQVSEDAAPGTTLTFGVALQPAGTDTYPSTAVSARLTVLEPSNLVVSLTPATLRTVVGHRATITGIVHNEGPGAAPDAVAVALAINEKHVDETHFAITDGTGLGAEGDSTVVVIGGASPSPLRAQLQRQAIGRHAAPARRHALPSLRFWPLGTIAPGATTRVPIRLRALSVGTDVLAFAAASAAGDADCPGLGGDIGGSDSGGSTAAPLERAPAAASTTTTPGPCSFVVQTTITAIPAHSDAPLANTGPNHLGLIGPALWALVLGSVLVWFGRRRPTAGRFRR